MVHPRPCVAFRAFKRIFDITSACLGLVLLSPLLLGTALAVKATSPGPVIFKQERYGRNKKPFVCFKFRSMMADTPADVPTRVMHENQSVMTPIGATLRKTSIDELPQLLNIVRGDMSTVGPRPALPNEVATYNDYQRQRLLVKPGMTCYWQTRRNRDSITFDEWVDFDLWGGVRTLIAFHPNISDAGAPIARNAPALCAGGSGQGYLQGVGPMTLTIGLSGN